MEHGLATAEEVEHGLGLMKDSGNLRACYWICPFCTSMEGIPRQFDTAKDFLAHVDACHEGIQMNKEQHPCCCVACNCEVSFGCPLGLLERGAGYTRACVGHLVITGRMSLVVTF